jgi:hypothetical protein
MATADLETRIKRDQFGAQLAYTAISSGQKGPGGELIVIGSGVLIGFIITTDGANPVTVDLYDKLSVGVDAEKLIPSFTVPGADRFGGAMLGPILFEKGLYLNVSGTGAKVVTYYMV